MISMQRISLYLPKLLPRITAFILRVLFTQLLAVCISRGIAFCEAFAKPLLNTGLLIILLFIDIERGHCRIHSA